MVVEHESLVSKMDKQSLRESPPPSVLMVRPSVAFEELSQLALIFGSTLLSEAQCFL